MIQVGIIDPNVILAEVMKEKVELSPDFTAELIQDFSPVLYREESKCDVILANLSTILGLEDPLSLSHSIPLLLTSSFADLVSQIQAYQLGARGLVSKSFRPEVLHRSIFQCLEGGMELSYTMRTELKAFAGSASYAQVRNDEERALIQMIVKGKSMESAPLRLGLKKREIHQSLRKVFSLMISIND